MMIRRIGSAVAAVAVIAGLAACGGSESDAGSDGSSSTDAAAKGAKLAFFAPVQNGYIQAMVDGAKAAVAKRGGSIETVFAAGGDPAKQLEQIKTAQASKRYDGLVVVPLAPTVRPAIEAAIKAKVPIGVLGGTLGADPLKVEAVPGAAITAGQPGTSRVAGLAEAINKACGPGPCEVAYILGLKTYPADNALLEAVKDALKPHPNVKLVAVGEGEYQAGPARTATTDILGANPGVKVIAANSDEMTRGAELAVQAAGKKDIKLIGVGASKAGCAAVEAGRWFATANDVPRSFGVVAADGVLDAIEDPKKVDNVVDPLEKSGLGPVFMSGTKETCPAEWSS